MTPLKAIENIQAVKAVASTRYPKGAVCAHPECDRTDVTQHHIFGRPPGENSDSWFVLLPVNGEWQEDESSPMHPKFMAKRAIPHVVALCGHGTAGHHGDVEAHNAWIKYEDGIFVWYDLVDSKLYTDEPAEWNCLGPLDPQPFDWGSKAKKPKPRKQGAERRKSATATFRLPGEMFGTEEVRGMLDDALEQFEELWQAAQESPEKRTAGATLVDAVLCGLLWIQNEGPLGGGYRPVER